MNILNLKVSSIKPYDKNAKKHPEAQIQSIANSIQQFGFRVPILVDKNSG